MKTYGFLFSIPLKHGHGGTEHGEKAIASKADLLKSLQRPCFPPPSWAEIESSLHALNGADRPLLTLVPQGGLPEGYLTVQGRPDAYTLSAYVPGRGRFRYVDETMSCQDVKIHSYANLRDYAERSYICTELTRVVGIVRHFWEFGQLHPSMTWEAVEPY
jgi:hypothetical protein